MIRFLTSHDGGWVEIPSRNKYRMFEKMCIFKDGKEEIRYLFVGNNGAVRINKTKNAAESLSFTEKYKILLEKYETKNNLMETTI